MKKFFTKKNRYVIIGALFGCAVLIFAANLFREALEAPRFTTVATTTPAGFATSSTEEAVDTGISLEPATAIIGAHGGSRGTAPGKISTSSSPASGPTSVPVAPTPTPTPAYTGCDLSLTFAITGGNLSAAGTMDYSLDSKNVGNVACASPSISVYYANNETYASSNPKATADGYYWKLSDLVPGAEQSITLATNRTSALPAGAVVNEACLSANNGADSCADASVGGAATSPAGNSGAAPVNTAANTPAAISGNTPTPSPASAPATTIAIKTPSTAPASLAAAVSSGKEIGVWVWTPVDQMTSAQMQQTINDASANRFTAIYLTIDDYLTVAALPDGAAKQQQLASYSASLENFISMASAKGMSVDAESGWRDWGEAGMTTNAPKIMAFVAAFNESHTQKFRGVQYDIEPYLLPQYSANEGGILTDYVTLIANLVNQDQTNKLPLTIIVPDFYTETQQWTPTITVGGVTDYTYNQIVRLLNGLPGSRVIVMAYRNSPSGSNGSIALSTPEIQVADATNVKVLIAQETGPVTPSYVTFNGLSRSSLFSAVGTINQTFAGDSSYAGVAVDYLDTYLSLP